MSAENVCARCPKVLGTSCCQLRPGEQLATLTWADVRRIREHTGWSARRFVEEEWMSEGDAADYEARRPLYRGYFRREPKRLTLAQRNAACVFLDPVKGCSLGEARPLACRLYPFEQWADGSWSVAVGRAGDLAEARAQGGACLAVEEATEMRGVLAAFGFDQKEVEALGARLIQEAAAHGRGQDLR